jgi:hypothetical protein
MTRILALAMIASLLAASGAFADERFPIEQGFHLLFNGKNFDGWKTKEGKALDGEKEAFDGRFKIKDGTLIIDPEVKGDVTIKTDEGFAKDLELRFDYLPGKDCNNDIFIRGVKFDFKKDAIKNMKMNNWNQFEISIHGDTLEMKNNGESFKKITVRPDSTPFSLRAEFGAMKVRNLRAKSE